MFDARNAVRTTLAIDDDVLYVAKSMARQQNRSVGEIISDLARRSIARPTGGGERNGVPLLSPKRGVLPVTLETVNALRDEVP